MDQIESICCIPSDGFDEIWMSVSRENGRMIERMALRDSYADIAGVETLLPENYVFTDSSITFPNAASGDIGGLSHLASEEVYILADGEVLNTQIVSAGGTINISSSYSMLVVGLPYSADLETLNVNVDTKTGTLQGIKTKIGNVLFRLLNTRGGWIGPDDDNLYEAFTTTNLASATELSDPLGTYPVQLFSVDLRMPLGASYESGGKLFYRQKDPLPVTILAVIPEVSAGGPSSG